MNRAELIAAKTAIAQQMATLNAEMDRLEALLQIELAAEEPETIDGLGPTARADIAGALASADAEGRAM